MSDYYFNLSVGNRRSLCISPLTREELAGSGTGNGPGLGYFLYERDDSAEGVNVLAKIVSEDAAVRLMDALASVSGR